MHVRPLLVYINWFNKLVRLWKMCLKQRLSLDKDMFMFLRMVNVWHIVSSHKYPLEGGRYHWGTSLPEQK